MAITGLLAGSAATATAASAATSQPARAQAAAAVHRGAELPRSPPHPASRRRCYQWHRAARDLARQPVGAVPRQRPGSAVHVPGDGGPGQPQPVGGTIDHSGGILFLNLKNGKKIEVSSFTIDLTHADLTGTVNGNPQARVPLFGLDLSHARLAAGKHIVTASRIG